MFDYRKENEDFIFTREDNKTVVFRSNGEIIGIKGSPLKRLPQYFTDCVVSIAQNGYLEDTIAVIETFCNLSVPIPDNPNTEYMGIVERLFKVYVQKIARKTTSMPVDKILDILIMAKYLAEGLINNTLGENVQESEVIKFLQNYKLPYHFSRYNLFYDFKQWRNFSSFWDDLPPIDYPEPVKKIVEFLQEWDGWDDASVRALKQAVSNHLIINLYILFSISDDYCAQTRTKEALIRYFILCKDLEETPNLNGNFINKITQLERKKEAAKSEIFQKHQNTRNLFFEDERLFVIVPQTVDALIQEGEQQHNCVGEYGYDKKIMQGACNIVFIRRKDNPDKSYITCEIDANGRIIQYLFTYNESRNYYENTGEETFRQNYQEHLDNIW